MPPIRASVRSAPEKSARPASASNSIAPFILAWLRLACRRVVLLRLAPVRSAPARLAPRRRERCRLASLRLAPARLAPVKSRRLSLAPERSQPGQSLLRPARKAATSRAGGACAGAVPQVHRSAIEAIAIATAAATGRCIGRLAWPPAGGGSQGGDAWLV